MFVNWKSNGTKYQAVQGYYKKENTKVNKTRIGEIKMKLIIVRHGETEENLSGIVQGCSFGKLNKKGKSQIKKLAARLKKEKIGAIFSSDLERCKQTTREIAKYHKAVPIHYTKTIRERSCGIFEGKPVEELINHRQKLGIEKTEFRPEKGENYSDVKERAKKFLEKIREKYKNKTVLIVSHGIFNKMLISVITGKPIDEAESIEQYNCCMNIIEISDRTHSIYALNSIEHLEAKEL